MHLLRHLTKRSAASGALAPSSDEPSAIDYVEWLLKYMLRTYTLELTVDSGRELPGKGDIGKENAPPCLPDQALVLNRLKLLSGLNPMRLSAPAEGRFERPCAGHTLVVATRFEDGPASSTCRVRLGLRTRNG